LAEGAGLRTLDPGALYQADASQAGVFIDRHVPGARIFMLRRPAVPSVIVETHHGLDLAEVEQWKEPSTRERFADALAAGLAEALEAIAAGRGT
jgi:N-acetylmuramoyl-L-alanine amidase